MIHSYNEYKNIAITAMHRLPNLIGIEFFNKRKPDKSEHILLRVDYKNDSLIRMNFLFKKNINFYQVFNSQHQIKYMLTYMSVLEKSLSKNKDMMLSDLPTGWSNMNIITFDRKNLQKFLNLK